jgi:hypothetical protein
MTHTCNPSYLEGWDWEVHDLRPARANSLRDPHLQNKQSKMDWIHGSRGRLPALQVQNPDSHPPPKKIAEVLLGVPLRKNLEYDRDWVKYASPWPEVLRSPLSHGMVLSSC